MKQVLNVGQCDYDHQNIATFIARNFDASVSAACTADQALQSTRSNSYDLILINRVLDGDGSSGIDLIQQLKDDPGTRSVPAMLVSNYSDAQAAAIEVGAVPGFGKSTMDTPATLEELKKVLG